MFKIGYIRLFLLAVFIDLLYNFNSSFLCIGRTHEARMMQEVYSIPISYFFRNVDKMIIHLSTNRSNSSKYISTSYIRINIERYSFLSTNVKNRRDVWTRICINTFIIFLSIIDKIFSCFWFSCLTSASANNINKRY